MVSHDGSGAHYARVGDQDPDGDGLILISDLCPHQTYNNCADADGDGVPIPDDAFPDDPGGADSDGDGFGDNSDVFPDDSVEWADSDGDGFGDNSGRVPRRSVGADSDGDGVGDNSSRQMWPVTGLVTGGSGSSQIWIRGSFPIFRIPVFLIRKRDVFDHNQLTGANGRTHAMT